MYCTEIIYGMINYTVYKMPSLEYQIAERQDNKCYHD